MNDDLLKLLDEQNWNDTFIRLAAYVEQYCRWKRYRLPKGLESKDIALAAIEKTYSGKRNWDYQAQPDLQYHLQSVANSIISNELNTGAAGEQQMDGIDEDSYQTANFADEELYSRQLDEKISAAMRGDPVLCLVYKALKDGLKPREIAEEYAIEKLQVQLAQKRLRRMAEKIIDDLAKVKNHE